MIPILLIEDHKEYRETIRSLLSEVSDFEILGDFDRVELALDLTSFPKVIFLDIHLPGKSGIDGIPLLKQAYRSAHIIMLTSMMDDDSIFQSIRNGADGYLLKSVSLPRLIESVYETVDGGASMTPRIARKVMDAMRPAPSTPNTEQLSSREEEVLKLLVRGMNSKAIGSQLFISPETVRTHVRHIYDKLHVNSRSEMVVVALKNKLV